MGLVKKLLICSAVVLIIAVLWHWANYVDIEGMPNSVNWCLQKICLAAAEFYAGKVVILTGASRGIGKSLAIQLAKLGAKYE